MALLDYTTFKNFLENDAQLVDTRDAAVFSVGFIPGSLSIAATVDFSEWAKILLDPESSILLVTSPGDEANMVQKLQSLGFKNILGALDGGYETWVTNGWERDLVIDIEPDELLMDLPFDENLVLVDVRKALEFAEGHQKQAVNIPLQEMIDPMRIAQFEDDDNIYLYSNDGLRSLMAAALLKKQGIHNVRNISGGLNELRRYEKADIVKEPEVLN